MDLNTANILRRLNNEFYATQAASFSATRQHAWPGWQRVAQHIRASASASKRASACASECAAILDIACGTMRFEKFWNDSFGAGTARFCAIDSCASLPESVSHTSFVERDIVSLLMNGEPIIDVDQRTTFDAAVSFGFMHHVPGFDMRMSLVYEMLGAVRPGGIVALTFWRFMANEKMAKRAQHTTTAGLQQIGDLALDAGDYLVGWQDRPGVFRYCHHFDDEEIDAIMQHASQCSTVIDRFQSDGRTNDLNDYLVLQTNR